MSTSKKSNDLYVVLYSVGADGITGKVLRGKQAVAAYVHPDVPADEKEEVRKWLESPLRSSMGVCKMPPGSDYYYRYDVYPVDE